MSSTSWGFTISVLSDFVVFIVIVLIFFSLRKYRCNPDLNTEYDLYLKESAIPVTDLIKKILTTNLADIKENCGEEAHNYLYLNKLLAIFTSTVGFYSLIILIPTYNAGNSNTDSNFYNIGFVNVINNKDLIVAPLIVFIVNCGLSYCLLRLYTKQAERNNLHSTQNKYAVRILNLPQDFSQTVLTDQVFKCFAEEKARVYVVPMLFKAQEYKKELDWANDELLHYLDVEKMKGSRKFIRENYFFGEKLDAIDYWEEKVTVLKKKLSEEKEKSKFINSGVCIVSFWSPVNIQKIQQTIAKDYPLAIVTTIPNTDDIIWENIDINENIAKGARFCYTILFFIFFTLLLTPVAFLDSINYLIEGFGFSSALLGFLSIYAPEFISLVYQLIIVPKSVNFLVKNEHSLSKSHESISALRKYLLFYIFNMFLVPALGMQTIEILDRTINDNFENWSKEMAARINATSVWFMVYIVTQTFLINGKDLLQITRMLQVRFLLFRAISQREKYNAYLPEPMNYPLNYGTSLTFFTTVFVYSVSYPLILLFGSGYFWLRVRVI